MNPYGLDALSAPSAAIFAFTLIISYRATGSAVLATCLAFVKAGIFAVYFGLFFDGTYTFLDDWTYFDGGRELLRRDVGLTNLAQNWQLALVVGRGDHFVYYLYNAYAFRLFEEAYWAPVALNIILTAGIAFAGAKLAAAEFALPLRGFFVFLILHPDILAWSNVMNGKDILVLLLHVLWLVAMSKYLSGRRSMALVIGIPVVVVLLFLRFYVPVLFAVALVGSVLASRRVSVTTAEYLSGSLIVLGGAVAWIGYDTVQYSFHIFRDTFVNPAYGALRMALTPIPFNTQEAYAFLNAPAVVHWALMPFVILGAIYVWRIGSPFSRFFTTYVVVFMSLYAVFGELQGPRHRVQLDYAWAVFQFMGLTQFIRTIMSPRRLDEPGLSRA